MRMRPTHGAAAVFAATLAATVGSSGPAKAFFFLPIFQQAQSSFESKSGRSPGDNSRWRGGDRGRDEAAQPKPSIGTRAKRERRRAGAQFRPRRQHPRRYLRREARRGVQGED
jgi:hypothetical protein